MMPRISPKRRAAFDILDWLFFNQTWFVYLCEDYESLTEGTLRERELITLAKIRQRVDEEVANTGATGIAAQALKHTVYCFLEAGFSDDLVQKSHHADRFGMTDERVMQLSKLAEEIDSTLAARLHEYTKQFFMAMISVFCEKAHGVCTDTALAIAAQVDASLSDAPTTVKYRLTERIFSYEFITAPVEFMSWMYRINVLSSDKFVLNNATIDIADDFKARVGLLCEFTLMRDFMARQLANDADYQSSLYLHHMIEKLKGKMTDDAFLQLEDERHFYASLSADKEKILSTPTFDLARLADAAYLHDFLDAFARKHWRSRFWTASQRSWTGVIGAGMIRAYHSLVDPDRKITRNGNNYSKYDNNCSERSVAELVCDQLKKYGLACTAGSLYETYLERYMKQPGGLFHRVAVYHALQQKMDVVFPAWIPDPCYTGSIKITTP